MPSAVGGDGVGVRGHDSVRHRVVRAGQRPGRGPGRAAQLLGRRAVVPGRAEPDGDEQRRGDRAAGRELDDLVRPARSRPRAASSAASSPSNAASTARRAGGEPGRGLLAVVVGAGGQDADHDRVRGGRRGGGPGTAQQVQLGHDVSSLTLVDVVPQGAVLNGDLASSVIGLLTGGEGHGPGAPAVKPHRDANDTGVRLITAGPGARVDTCLPASRAVRGPRTRSSSGSPRCSAPACSGCGVPRRTRRGRGCRWRSSSPGSWRCASPRRARTWRGRIPSGCAVGGTALLPAGLARAGRPRPPGGARRGRRPRRRPCSAATCCRAGRCSPPSGSSWWCTGARRRGRRPGRSRSAWALVGGVGVVLFVAVLVGLAGAGGRQGDVLRPAAQAAVPVGPASAGAPGLLTAAGLLFFAFAGFARLFPLGARARPTPRRVDRADAGRGAARAPRGRGGAAVRARGRRRRPPRPHRSPRSSTRAGRRRWASWSGSGAAVACGSALLAVLAGGLAHRGDDGRAAASCRACWRRRAAGQPVAGGPGRRASPRWSSSSRSGRSASLTVASCALLVHYALVGVAARAAARDGAELAGVGVRDAVRCCACCWRCCCRCGGSRSRW